MPEVDLLLDGGHRYWLNSRRIPGATEILDGIGLIDTRWFTEESRVRGSAVHAAIHYHLQKDLLWSSVDERIKGYVEAAILCIADSGFEVIETEQRVVHLDYPVFAGTLDLYGVIASREEISDWKSGAIDDVHGVQTALYDIAKGGNRRRRSGVQLRPNGTYKKRIFDDRRDYQRALAAADLYTRFIFNPKEKAEEHDAANVA